MHQGIAILVRKGADRNGRCRNIVRIFYKLMNFAITCKTDKCKESVWLISIETDRLLLRNYRVTDFEDIIKYFSNEEVSRYEDFYPMSEEQVRNIITEWKDMDNRLVAELKSKRNVIGSVGYWIDDEGHYCIDYDFNTEYCGKGYATEASNALVHYLFESMGINTIYGDCDVQNVSSWKLLERLGFQRISQFDNQSYKNDENGNPILISTFLYKLDKAT